eukprot:7145297-Prymnesium_polylepis.2
MAGVRGVKTSFGADRSLRRSGGTRQHARTSTLRSGTFTGPFAVTYSQVRAKYAPLIHSSPRKHPHIATQVHTFTPAHTATDAA